MSFKFNFKQYVPRKGTYAPRFTNPTVAFRKASITFNVEAIKVIGAEKRFAACFYDEESGVVGFCFTKDNFPKALTWRVTYKDRPEYHRYIGTMGFYRDFGIMKKVEMLGKEHYPLVEAKGYSHPDYEGSIVYIVFLQ